jgi:hypothetical protein
MRIRGAGAEVVGPPRLHGGEVRAEHRNEMVADLPVADVDHGDHAASRSGKSAAEISVPRSRASSRTLGCRHGGM